MSNLYFAVLAVLFLAALLGTAVLYSLRARRSAAANWDDLLKRLVWIDPANIATIALDFLGDGSTGSPSQDATLAPEKIWRMLGGLQGLETIESNCRVLVELAGYIQRWHPEAVVVAEQLRLSSREIEWHVGRLKGAAATGNLESSFADYAQRATVTYYLMTRHLLSLYGQVSFPRLAELQQAI